MNLKACAKLDLRPLNGHWYRAIRLKYWETRLATGHSKTTSSRFSPAAVSDPRHRILYLGENHQVVLYEIGAVLGRPDDPVSNPKVSLVVMSLHVILENVADLCDPSQQKQIGTNRQELTGIWDDYPSPAPTQQLGVALEAVPDIEGFLFPSSKPPGRNLVVFPDKLGFRSEILFRNELTNRVERLR